MFNSQVGKKGEYVGNSNEISINNTKLAQKMEVKMAE